MAGAMIELLPKRVFDFGGLIPPSTQQLTVAERIDVSQFTDGIVILRVHSVNAAGGTITFDLLGDGETDEDPSIAFFANSPYFTATAIDSTFTAPTMRAYGGTVRGHYAELRITGNRTSGSPLNAAVSVALCLRSPDPS